MHYHPIDWKDDISELCLVYANYWRQEKDDEMIDEMQTSIGKCATLIELLKNPNDMVIETNNDFKGRVRLIAKPIRVNKIAPDYSNQLAEANL